MMTELKVMFMNPDEIVFEILIEKLTDKFRLVGSRAILTEPDITPLTDFDFIGVNSSIEEEYLLSLGFKLTRDVSESKKIKYMDVSTAKIFAKLNVQVCLKHQSYFENVNKLWGLLEKNPKLYRNYFWKSNKEKQIDPNDVRDRVNMFLTEVMPFVKV